MPTVTVWMGEAQLPARGGFIAACLLTGVGNTGRHMAVEWSTGETSAMGQALAEAYRGLRGANPLVGAAILDTHGKLIAVGHHRGAGSPHAEVAVITHALEQGYDLRGGSILVTLEPCRHHGRTPPCAQTIIDAGLAEVIYAVPDPDPAAGGGARVLRDAGLTVRAGLAADAARELNQAWLTAVVDRRPFVTAHIAQTLDGRIAAEDGTSQWISSPEALADNHAIRRRVEAILVGTGTLRIDNPRLTARNTDGSLADQQPLRVVMGLRPIPDEAAVRGEDDRAIHLATREPRTALTELYTRGVRHLMVEGGSQIISAFLAAGLVDELVMYLAPTLLGSGVNALGSIGVHTLAQAQSWEWDEAGDGSTQRLGRDIRLHLKPTTKSTSTGIGF